MLLDLQSVFSLAPDAMMRVTLGDLGALHQFLDGSTILAGNRLEGVERFERQNIRTQVYNCFR